MSRKAFADTTVAAGKTQQQIEDMLRKHGIDTLRWTSLPDRMVLEFRSEFGSFALSARYDLGDGRTDEANRRQVMRALHWYVKAKLDAVDFGLEDMMRAFMPYLVTAPGRILIDDVNEAVEQRRLGADIPMLPSG